MESGAEADKPTCRRRVKAKICDSDVRLLVGPKTNGARALQCIRPTEHVLSHFPLARTVPIASPETLFQHAETRLRPNERILGKMHTDLDANLHFHRGLVVLTNIHLFSVEQVRSEGIVFQSWKLTDVEDLVLEEMGSTAVVHLMQAGAQAHAWRVTSGRVREAASLPR